MTDSTVSEAPSADAQQVADLAAQAMYAKDRASQGLDIELLTVSPGRASMRMPIRADMVNGYQTCHGGIIFSLADSAFAFACNSHDRMSVAAAASIEFLRPARVGDVLTATAVEQIRGARIGIYDVAVRDQQGQLVALFRGRSHELGGSVSDTVAQGLKPRAAG